LNLAFLFLTQNSFIRFVSEHFFWALDPMGKPMCKLCMPRGECLGPPLSSSGVDSGKLRFISCKVVPRPYLTHASHLWLQKATFRKIQVLTRPSQQFPRPKTQQRSRTPSLLRRVRKKSCLHSSCATLLLTTRSLLKK